MPVRKNKKNEILQKVRSAEDKRIENIAWLILETGGTPAEISGLRSKDIQGSYITIGKAGKRRKLHCDAKLCRALKRHAASRGYVFPGRAGPLSVRRIEQILKQGSQAIGINISARELRKLYLEDAIKHGPATLEEASRLKSIRRRKLADLKGLGSISFTDTSHELILSILKETGCRISELADIRCKDVSFSHIKIGKGRKRRAVPVSSGLYYKLKRAMQDQEDYLISGKRRLSERRLQQIIKSYSNQAGRELTAGSIRNAFAQMLARQGLAAEEIAHLLGVSYVNLFTHGII